MKDYSKNFSLRKWGILCLRFSIVNRNGFNGIVVVSIIANWRSNYISIGYWFNSLQNSQEEKRVMIKGGYENVIALFIFYFFSARKKKWLFYRGSKLNTAFSPIIFLEVTNKWRNWNVTFRLSSLKS